MPSFVELVEAFGGGVPAAVIAILLGTCASLFWLRERDRKDAQDRERQQYEARLSEALSSREATTDAVKTIQQAIDLLGAAHR